MSDGPLAAGPHGSSAEATVTTSQRVDDRSKELVGSITARLDAIRTSWAESGDVAALRRELEELLDQVDDFTTQHPPPKRPS
jgi:hypothetical protein